MTVAVDELERRLGEPFLPQQLDALADWETQAEKDAPRACLYFRTGAGKTITSLALMAQRGVQRVLAIAPPITHPAWITTGRRLGVEVTPISHAKWRMPTFKPQRGVAIIADEVHMFGGSGGKGWMKLDRVSRHLKQPLIIMSATPNYNDIERCYCIEHILSPHTCSGGILNYVYTRCITEPNPYAEMPIVNGFQQFRDAEHYLSSLPHVNYLPDNVTVAIQDVILHARPNTEFETYGVSRRKGRIMASMMEAKHTRNYDEIVAPSGEVWHRVMAVIEDLLTKAGGPTLIYCDKATIAEALQLSLVAAGQNSRLITGKNSAKSKQYVFDQFKGGAFDVLVGTASLATGADGIDKMCDTLIIVNDTEDDSLRRQLIGRIMPRGTDVDTSGKKVFRLVMTS